jgi:hypothetical protein
VLHPPSTQLQGRGQPKLFPFNKVFGPTTDQRTVFQESLAELLPCLTEGRDLLCFTYGVTGAGKTFTIEGTPEKPGVLHQTLSALLTSLRSGRPVDLTHMDELTISCFEIFNEKVYDLLVGKGTPRTGAKATKLSLGLTRDADGKTVVEGVAEYLISEESQISHLIQTANAERHKAETTFNLNSSRSHVVYRLALRSRTKPAISISIVDLAGAERAKLIGDARMRESCNIKKSMMVLGRCIRSLANHQQPVPYRESLITRLFKDFFKSPGKCAVAAVIVNITPSVDQFEDTSFSLSFAVEASKCCLSGAASEEIEDTTPVAGDMEFQRELGVHTQKYLDNLEKCYQAQVDGIMQRTRSANLLHTQISEYVLRRDYEALQRENEELRAQLQEAVQRITELTNAD